MKRRFPEITLSLLGLFVCSLFTGLRSLMCSIVRNRLLTRSGPAVQRTKALYPRVGILSTTFFTTRFDYFLFKVCLK